MCITYVKRGALINRIHKELKFNDGYKESDKIVFLCGTNDLENNWSGGYQIWQSLGQGVVS